MRCYYFSDLHLERHDFLWEMPSGDLLIVAGDLCHAACLDAARTDLYAVRQRERVFRFADAARARFAHVLLVPGNHDHYDGIFEDTADTLAQCLPGFTVLDDAHVDIGGVRFFGTTLWSDFEGRSASVMNKARRSVGEYFFVKTRRYENYTEALEKLRPAHTLAAFDRAVAALKSAVGTSGPARNVVISHHAPSRKGANAHHVGNGLDGAYLSDLDAMIAGLPNLAVWVHGHTHIRRSYRVADTAVHVNCCGLDGPDEGMRSFKPNTFFDL